MPTDGLKRNFLLRISSLLFLYVFIFPYLMMGTPPFPEIQNEREAKEMLEKGDELVENGRFEEAFEAFQLASDWFESHGNRNGYLLAQALLGDTYRLTSEFEKAADYLFPTMEAAEREFGIQDSMTIEAITYTAYLHDILEEYADYERLLKKAIDASKVFYGERHEKTADLYRHLGALYCKTGDFEIGMEYARKALDIALEVRGESHPLVARIYGVYSKYYESIGDYESCLIYDLKELEIKKAYSGPEHRSLAYAYNHVGYTYGKLGRYEDQLEAYMKCLEIDLKAYGKKHAQVAFDYGNISDAHNFLGNDAEALEYAEKAARSARDIFGPNHISTAFYNGSLATLHANRKDIKKAIPIFRRNLKIYLAQPKVVSWDFAILCHNLARCYYYVNNLDSSLILTQQSLMTLVPDFNDPDPIRNPEVGYSIENDVLFIALQHKFDLFYRLYEEKKDISYLHAAVAVEKRGMEQLDFLLKNNQSEASERLIFEQQKVSEMFEGAIKAQLQMFQVEEDSAHLWKALEILEQSKALTLLGSLQGQGINTYGKVPESVAKRQDSLDAALRRIQLDLLRASDPETKGTEEEISQLRDEFFSMQKSHRKSLSSIQQEYPEYYALRYDPAPAQGTQIRDMSTRRDLCILEYFIGRRFLFIFHIEGGKIEIQQIEKPEALEERLQSFVESLQKPEKSCRTLANDAFYLYQQLWEPIAANIRSKQILIIREGMLNALPFETLIRDTTESSSCGRMAWLLHDYQISYANSASRLAKYPQKAAAEVPILGFAPGFSRKRAADSAYALLNPLENSVNFLEELSGTFAAENFYYEAAGEGDFKRNVTEQSRILQIASHAEIDEVHPELSRIWFAQPADSTEDGSLYLNEIYNLELNAPLTILSACQTGDGKTFRSIGAMSLAQAFEYAGCPSIVMTRWQVDEEVTMQILGRFYDALAEGKTGKQNALAKAKRSFSGKRGRKAATSLLLGGNRTAGGSGADWDCGEVCKNLALGIADYAGGIAGRLVSDAKKAALGLQPGENAVHILRRIHSHGFQFRLCGINR